MKFFRPDGRLAAYVGWNLDANACRELFGPCACLLIRPWYLHIKTSTAAQWIYGPEYARTCVICMRRCKISKLRKPVAEYLNQLAIVWQSSGANIMIVTII